MTTNIGSNGTGRCSFCGKSQDQVHRLVGGQGDVFICDECIKVCHQVLDGDKPTASAKPRRRKLLTPREITEHLDRYVVGQQRAKKTLSVAVYNHYKRVWYEDTQSGVELQKTNILMAGPTGSGKTLLGQTLARILDVPFTICNATSLTESGYVGEDVENILLRLIQAADWDIARAEQGIIYIDEIDKIARKEGSNRSITRDVSGEGVQQELLKIVEGCCANVPPQGGRKHPYQEFIQIRTDNILFICGGVFEGLESIVARRVGGGERLGFKAGSSERSEEGGGVLRYMALEDMLEYGFIPEMVGRLPVAVTLDLLDKDALIKVLTQPQSAIVKQYEQLFSMDKVELEFTTEALESAALEALKRKTGARGLRTIIEGTLLDVMYELPSLKGVSRCIIDGDVIMGRKHPLLLTASGQVIEPPVEWQLSA